MARLRATELADGGNRPPQPRPQSYRDSASPAASDKENDHSGALMSPPSVSQTVDNGKRRRLESIPPNPTPAESEPVYDPHQDKEERQQLRKGLRDLNRDVHDLRTEWLRSDSSGLKDAIVQTNTFFKNVKQTSDATIDSRFLVSAGELAYRKTQLASIGDGSQGIDVDEFVSKAIHYMNDAETSTHHVAADEDEQDVGDALNWAWLGSRACFATNTRPPLPGLLLGPLSVAKKIRPQLQRRARQQRVDAEQAVKPLELQVTDLQQQEGGSLKTMCQSINKQLESITQQITDAEEKQDDQLLDELVEKYAVFSDGGVSLFHFAVNPRSFGQTVENLFYVSFLIRDGVVGIDFDSRGLPTLHEAPRRAGVGRFQAVLGLDFDDWQAIVSAWNIKESLIPHREEDEETQNVGQTAWYG